MSSPKQDFKFPFMPDPFPHTFFPLPYNLFKIPCHCVLFHGRATVTEIYPVCWCYVARSIFIYADIQLY